MRNSKGQFIKGVAPKNRLNLTGQRYGRLVAIVALEKRKNQKVVWLCKCDCENFTEVVSAKLRNGHTISCGCRRKEILNSFNDISGQRFGRLVAINRVGKNDASGGFIWLCECDCGREKEISNNQLQNGQQSCGCLLDEYRASRRIFPEDAYKHERDRGSLLLSDSYIINNLTNISRGSGRIDRKNITDEMIEKTRRDIKRKRNLFDNEPDGWRRCSACLHAKKHTEFSPEKNCRFGVSAVCKDCVNKKLFRGRKGLSDRYIKTALRNTHGIYDSDVTPRMIELKREHIEKKRLIKKRKNEKREVESCHN